MKDLPSTNQLLKELAPEINDFQSAIVKLSRAVMRLSEEHVIPPEAAMAMMVGVPPAIMRDGFLSLGLPAEAIRQTFSAIGADTSMEERMENHRRNRKS